MALNQVQETIEETKQQLCVENLVTECSAKETKIKDEEEEGPQSPSRAPVNPYAGLTNSGIRKRKAREVKEKESPYAPNAPKPRPKKPTAPGRLLDTTTLQRYSRSDVQVLKYVKTLLSRIENALQSGEDLSRLFNILRKALHEAEFVGNLCGDLVADSRLLEVGGLSSIFSNDAIPYDIKDDARVLHNKWSKGLYNPHLLHGISHKKHAQTSGKDHKSNSLETDYTFKVSANYVGAGNFINGQWWPYQICAIRDGAHGDSEAGISGVTGKGAFSVIVGSSGYADIDNGDEIKYCGTLGSLGQPTARTKLLIDAHRLHNPLRVLRSGTTGKKHSVYQPVIGLRYDGLYQITNDEVLDQGTGMHRFTLHRIAGQSPIRYTGVESRPTPEEIHAFTSIREGLGLKS